MNMRRQCSDGRRRGMALMVVVGAIAVASLLALAMLSSSSLQAQMGGTLEQAAQADYLAESGVNYAIHQLRKTAASDDVFTGGTYSLGGDGRERFIVTVTRRPGSATDYDILAHGELLNAGGEVIAAKTSAATVKATAHLKYDQAAIFGGNEVRLESNGKIQIESASARRIITSKANTIGTLFTQYIGGTLEGIGDVNLIPDFPYRVTPTSAVRTFHDAPYLYADGNLYWADPLPSTNLSNVKLGPTPSNPAGVYYGIGNVKLLGNVEINGSLIVLNGSLTVDGLNNEINASRAHSQGFPALVVRDGSLVPPVAGLGRVLEVKGASWIGGSLGTPSFGLFCKLEFDGVVILPNGTIALKGTSVFAGELTIHHDSATSDIPRLDRELISDVEIVAWTSP